MKLRNLLFSFIAIFIISMVSNLYFNLKINNLFEELSTLKTELVELEVEKSNTHLIYIKSFSTSNMELLSKSMNYRRLDIHNKNKNLVKPYKLEDGNKPIVVLGFGGK
jgi:glycerophosphoryl diester phosphodiesterase